MAYRPTRVLGQDMKTGQFAYLDQLIQDGYYPNLWVLPENYEPPVREGSSIQLPLEPIFNFSPPNISDGIVIPLRCQVVQSTGLAVGLPYTNCAVGTVVGVVS